MVIVRSQGGVLIQDVLIQGVRSPAILTASTVRINLKVQLISIIARSKSMIRQSLAQMYF